VNEDKITREEPLFEAGILARFPPAIQSAEDVAGAAWSDGLDSRRSPPRPLLAWVVILLSAAYVIGLQASRPSNGARLTGGDLANDLQAKYLVGVAQFSRNVLSEPSAREGFSGNRRLKQLRWTLLTHAVGDPVLARRELDLLTSIPGEAPGEEQDLMRVVTGLIGAEGTPDRPQEQLSPEDLDLIRSKFGWLGRLAVTSTQGEEATLRAEMLGQAQRTMAAFIGLVVVGIMAMVIGTGLLVGWVVCAVNGKLQFRWRLPSGTGGYYAETFALWFVTFFGLSVLLGWLAPPQLALTAAGVGAGLSLLTLFWPVWRGVPLQQVQQELGIFWPPGGWREVCCGVLGYIGGLPIVFLGLLVTLLLMRWQTLVTEPALFAFAEPPVHPIIEPLARGSMWIRLQAVAVVLLVPITEEIMFRGVLYRHLRELFGRWGWLVSLILSLLTSSFLFAVIHPQGALGVPLLTAVAIVLALLREWRASLIAPIVTHMIVNGVTTTLVLLIFA
jgi:membrane protease YdiL (CAAX protease family)